MTGTRNPRRADTLQALRAGVYFTTEIQRSDHSAVCDLCGGIKYTEERAGGLRELPAFRERKHAHVSWYS